MRSLFKKTFFLLALLLLFPAGGRADDDLSFRAALKKYHRHGEFFNNQNLHASIVWDVVYKSGEFREALARRYAKAYRLTDQELSARLLEEKEEARLGPEFMVILYTYDRKWNDLDKEDTIWRIRLAAGNESFEPVRITKLKPTPLDQTFYPFMETWTHAYLVLFPPGSLADDLQTFQLSLFGIKGHQTLTWNFSK
jgi:hypothetical protein